MGKKLDTSAINAGKVETGVNTGAVYSAIEKGTDRKRGTQGKASKNEQNKRASELRTRGRRGCRAERINMAFTPENYDFVKVMSGVTGQSMTEFVNFALDKYREQYGDLLEKAREIRDSLLKGTEK